MSSSLAPFFSPRGVVVVGVSTSPEKLGFGVARNLAASGFPGAIHLVGQKGGELLGRPIHTDLAQVPDPVDLAVLVVPAAGMAEAIQSCAERGIHAAIVISSGFREVGEQGAALENQCLEIARRSEIRLLGPNCIGTIDTHLPLDTTFLQTPLPAAGGIAFVSHSGAFCAAIIDWSRRQGFGFSRIASLGNQADVDETEMLPLVAAAAHTRVIALYMEGVRDGRRFVEAAREITRQKPVVALKVGRSESGQKAAASHTGALAASDTGFEAAFEKAGIFRAATAEQLFDWARALEVCPLPDAGSLRQAAHGVAVLTNAGGPGVIAADALEANGLRLAQLSATTKQALAQQLPAAAAVSNPVDMLASASPQNYADCLRLLLQDSNAHSALVILPPPPMYAAELAAEALIPLIRDSRKPVLVALLGSDRTAQAFERFSAARVASYPFPERAASALAVLARRAEYLDRGPQAIERPVQGRPSAVETSDEELLASYGVTVEPAGLARSADEAAEFARKAGYPVVLKIASSSIPHKSDAGGVVLDLRTEAEVRRAYAQILDTAMASHPQAVLDGVRVQHQVPKGQEVIVGAVRDPSFGPLIMFGSGGIEAEGLRDVAFALGPLSPAEAESLMQRTWAGRRLGGFRNLAAANWAAVRDVLVQLSWLAADHPEIAEIEINPLVVLEEGAFAVDVRARRS